MEHLTTEDILNYLEGTASDAEHSKIEAHLADCAECFGSLRQLDALVVWLREDASYEPPADLVEKCIGLFPPTPDPNKVEK